MSDLPVTPEVPGSVILRPLRQPDLRRVVELNNAAVPAVPHTDAAAMMSLLEFSDLSLVAVGAESEAAVLGFVIAVPTGSDYASENYRWFEGLAKPHVYIDRIVIAEQARGRGVGRLLYDAVFSHARGRNIEWVTCEVNTEPPNPSSMAFHSRLGFKELGRQMTKGGTVGVALLAAEVSAP